MPIKPPPRASGVVHCTTIPLQGKGHGIDSSSGEIHMSGVNEARDSQLLQLQALKPELPQMRLNPGPPDCPVTDAGLDWSVIISEF